MTIDKILERFHLDGRRNPRGYGEPMEEAKQSIREAIEYVIGEDYPTPNDGRVDSNSQVYLRRLRREQRQRMTEVFGLEPEGQDAP